MEWRTKWVVGPSSAFFCNKINSMHWFGLWFWFLPSYHLPIPTRRPFEFFRFEVNSNLSKAKVITCMTPYYLPIVKGHLTNLGNPSSFNCFILLFQYQIYWRLIRYDAYNFTLTNQIKKFSWFEYLKYRNLLGPAKHLDTIRIHTIWYSA